MNIYISTIMDIMPTVTLLSLYLQVSTEPNPSHRCPGPVPALLPSPSERIRHLLARTRTSQVWTRVQQHKTEGRIRFALS